MVLALGLLLAAALMLTGGTTVSQAGRSELVRGSSANPIVLAEGVAGPRRPMDP
ncbi:hypothetical protein [Nonomuraea sp. NPDC002799]